MRPQKTFFIFLPILAIGLWLLSCNSNTSTVCQGIGDSEMCIDYQTSGLTYQFWEQTNLRYKLHISNEGNEYNDVEVVGIFTIYDGVFDSVPQKGVYKGGINISSGNSFKQFAVDISINGENNYSLDPSNSSTLEITAITGETLHGTIHCYLYDHLQTSQKKELYVNFSNLYHQ